jgi:hypothetical protein
MAANGHSCPATPSYVQPRNTWPDGTSSLVWHHPATPRPRLTVKQVHTELVLDFADPGGLVGLQRVSQARPEIRAACRAAVPSPMGNVSADVSGPGSRRVGQSSAALDITLCAGPS